MLIDMCIYTDTYIYFFLFELRLTQAKMISSSLSPSLSIYIPLSPYIYIYIEIFIILEAEAVVFILFLLVLMVLFAKPLLSILSCCSAQSWKSDFRRATPKKWILPHIGKATEKPHTEASGRAGESK